MEKLECFCADCEHNHACRCGAGIVNMDKAGVCRTRQRRGLGMLGQKFEAAQDFALVSDSHTLVQCDCTDCLYNKGRLCCSAAISVRDKMLRTKCTTKKEG